jgi:hypothetical protein
MGPRRPRRGHSRSGHGLDRHRHRQHAAAAHSRRTSTTCAASVADQAPSQNHAHAPSSFTHWLTRRRFSFLSPPFSEPKSPAKLAGIHRLFIPLGRRTYADLFRFAQGKKEIGAFEITRRRSSPARQTRSGMVPVSTAQPPSSRNSTRRRMMISRYGWCSTRKYRGSTLLHHLTPTCHGYQGTIPIAPRGREDNQHVMLVLELKINGRREIIKHGQFRTVVLFTCLQKL